ncbi:MAG TPA: gamma-glutamyltransferase [Thermoanaerobaculia bacterium]|nr:gamma-glutamyltransferase [Thermoanaerobaculia bacterium]
MPLRSQRPSPTLPGTLVALLLVCLLLPAPARAASQSTPYGNGGAVSSADPQATEAGLAMLRSGGNATDAAVATALALAVVYPEAGNLGGGGFAVLKSRDEIRALDFREVAPAAARPDLYLDAQGEPIPGASLVGPLASGVPGSPTGLYELQLRHGRLPWKQVVAPAIRLAEDGFFVTRHLNGRLENANNRKALTRFPETMAVWYPGGKPLEVGARVRLPDLAQTLREYAEKGPAALSSGRVAAAILEASRRHGGILTAEDLAGYKPVWREPLRFEAFGWRFASMPLPSSGGIILGQTFGMLERLGWGQLPRYGADRDHLLVEVFRRSFADRFLLGDPATTRATADQLLAPAWLDARAAAIDRQRATASSAVRPWPGDDAKAAAVRDHGGETTHLSVIDRDGNVVALTTTLNGLFGCGLWVPGAGYFLNNEMDDFTTAPGRPNLFGLIQGEANAVGPGKKMLSAMTPVIAWRGEESIAVGGRGGSQIPTNTAQVLLNLLVDGDSLQAALDRPRIHQQWYPDRVEVEADTLSPETRAELERRGQTIKVLEASDIAKIHAVRRRADGRFEAASDPRGTGLGGILEPVP